MSAFEPTILDDAFSLNAEMPVGILSPSSISTYLACPEQFRRAYISGEKKGRGAWAVSGTAFHEARHAALEWQMANGAPLPADDIQGLYETAWDKSLGEGGIEWTPTAQKEQHDIGFRMFMEYQESLGRFVQPIALETWVKGYVAGVPVPVLGKADVIEHSQVIDTKTGKNLFHKPQPSHMIQGAIYIFCTGLPIRWHSVSQKPAATTNNELVMYPTPKVLAAAERYVRDAYEGIRDNLRARGPHDIWPVHGPAAGTCRYCGLRGTCPGYPDAS